MLDYDYSEEEAEQLPTEYGDCKFELIDGKWHVKGPCKDLQGKGPWTFHTKKGPVTIPKEKLRHIKRYQAKHPKGSRQNGRYYICKYDLYEVLRDE